MARNPKPTRGPNNAPSHEAPVEYDDVVSQNVEDLVDGYWNAPFKTVDDVFSGLEAVGTIREGLPAQVQPGTEVKPDAMKRINRVLRLGIDAFEMGPGQITQAESEAAGGVPFGMKKDVWQKLQSSTDAKDQARVAAHAADAKRRLALSTSITRYKTTQELADAGIVTAGKNHRGYIQLNTDRKGNPVGLPLVLSHQNMQVLRDNKDQITDKDNVAERKAEVQAYRQGIRDARIAPIDQAKREDRHKVSEMIGHLPGDMQDWMTERGIAVTSQNVASHLEAYKASYTRTELMAGRRKPNFNVKPNQPTRTERLRDAVAGPIAKVALAVAANVPAGLGVAPANQNAAPVQPNVTPPPAVVAPAAPNVGQVAPAPHSPEQLDLARRVWRALGNVALEINPTLEYWFDGQRLWSRPRNVPGNSPANVVAPAQSQPPKVKHDANGNVVRPSKHKGGHKGSKPKKHK